jgi:hypothetical protein
MREDKGYPPRTEDVLTKSVQNAVSSNLGAQLRHAVKKHLGVTDVCEPKKIIIFFPLNMTSKKPNQMQYVN